MKADKSIQKIRIWTVVFMTGLILSGLTAIPVQQELDFVCRFFPVGSTTGNWLETVQLGLADMKKNQPWVFYGFDWLAFAHIAIAVFCIGLYRDPLRNRWVAQAALLICFLLIPFAMIAGAARGIPFWWRMVDALFGLTGAVPLWIILRTIPQINTEEEN